jgi:hypothetical protein
MSKDQSLKLEVVGVLLVLVLQHQHLHFLLCQPVVEKLEDKHQSWNF